MLRNVAVVFVMLVFSGCVSQKVVEKDRSFENLNAKQLAALIDNELEGSAAQYVAKHPAALGYFAKTDRADLIDVLAQHGYDFARFGHGPLGTAIANRKRKAAYALAGYGADIHKTNALQWAWYVHNDGYKKAGIERTLLALELGDRKFMIPKRTTGLYDWRTGYNNRKTFIDIGPWGALLLHQGIGDADLANAYRQGGVKPEQLDREQTLALKRQIRLIRFARGVTNNVDLGKVMAAAAVVTGAGVLAAKGGTEQAGQFLQAGITDIASGGTSNMQRLANQPAINTASRNASGVKARTGQTLPAAQQTVSLPQDFTITCPGTGFTHTIKITGKSPACRQAQREYGRAASCNLVGELEARQKQYYSACATEMYDN